MGQTSQGHFDGSGAAISLGAPSFRTLYAHYRFSVNGGGTGTYTIGTLRNGESIVGGWVTVVATPTAVSGTPTIAVQCQTANDLVTAASILGAPWSTVGKKAITPKINTPESTSITLTADHNVDLLIGTAAINTGDIVVRLFVTGPLDT